MSQPTIRGVYKKGRVRLLEPAPVDAETPVLVVFLGKAADRAGRDAWLTAARKSFLKGYSRGDAAYDAL